MLLWAIIGGIILLLLLLFFLPTELGIDYLLENKEQVLRVRIKLFGIPFSVKVPLKKDKKKSASKEQVTKEDKPLTPKGFIAFSKSLYHAYQKVEDDSKALLRELKRNFKCKEIYFTIRYGTHNPARTGILNGAIWTAGTLVLNVLDSALGVGKKTLAVYPDFNRAFMRIHIKGRFRFNGFDAVKAVLKVIKLVNLIKNEIENKE